MTCEFPPLLGNYALLRSRSKCDEVRHSRKSTDRRLLGQASKQVGRDGTGGPLRSRKKRRPPFDCVRRWPIVNVIFRTQVDAGATDDGRGFVLRVRMRPAVSNVVFYCSLKNVKGKAS